MRGLDREGHQLGRLVAGVAEHHALIARALLLVQSFAFGDALGDVGRLSLDGRDDRAGVAVEASGGVGIANVAHDIAHDFVVADSFFAGDLAGDDDHAGLRQGLAGNAAVGIAVEMRVEYRIGDLVAHLVRMPFGDRLRSEKKVFRCHLAYLQAFRKKAESNFYSEEAAGNQVSLIFEELVVDQLFDGGENGFRLAAPGLDLNFAPLRRGEREHAHDAPSVDRLTVLGDRHLGVEFADRLDKQRRGARVQAELVLDLEVFAPALDFCCAGPACYTGKRRASDGTRLSTPSTTTTGRPPPPVQPRATVKLLL